MATGGDLTRSVAGGSEELVEFPCSPCQREGNSVESDVYCEECAEYLCQQCLKFHNRYEKMKGHVMLDKSDFKGQDHRKLASAPTEKCRKHHGRLLDTYCGVHDEVCCVTCVSLKHTACGGLEYLSDVAEGIATSSAMQNFTQSLDTLDMKLGQLKDMKTKTVTENDEDARKAKYKINATYDHIAEHLDKLRNAAMEDVDKACNDQKDKLNNDIKQITEMETTVRETKNVVDPAKEKNETKLFVQLKRQEGLVGEIDDKLNQLENTNTKKMEFTVTKLLVDFAEKVQTFGVLNDGPLNESEFVIKKPGHKINVCEKKDEYAECNITDICQMKDGTIIISDYRNNNLKRLDKSYRVLSTLSLVDSPKRMCCVGPGELVVALHMKGRIEFVSVTDSGMRLMSKTISIGKFYCRGVYCYEDELYVTCGAAFGTYECLKVFDKTGDLLRTVKNTHIQPVFGEPEGIVVSENDGTLFIADREKGVLNMDRQGNVLSVYTTDSLLDGAKSISTIGKDALLVCNYKSGTLVRLEPNVNTRTILLDQTDGLKLLQTVFLDREQSKLLVGMDSSEHLLVFDVVQY